MRYSPAHAAKSGSVPFMLRGPKPVRMAMSAAVAGIVGLVPTVLVASPAHAADGVYSIIDASATEGNSVVFTISRAPAGVGDPLPEETVNWATSDGTAGAGSDYTAVVAGTVTFPAYTNTTVAQVRTISVTTLQDTTDEVDAENFTVTLTASLGSPAATFSDDTAIGTINDDDNPTYTLTSLPTTVNESTATPQRKATITATLSKTSTFDVTIPVATADGTAKTPQDYVAVDDAIVIQAGQTIGTITVDVEDDAIDEAAIQSFTVVGSTGTNVAGTQTATVNIADDDEPPVINIASGGSIQEGSTLTFNATLSGLSENTVTARWDTVDGPSGTPTPGNGTAVAGLDYTAVTNGTVSFAPLASTPTTPITVTTSLDNVDEATEDLNVKLTQAVNGTVGTPSAATGSITDSGTVPGPQVTLTPTEVVEGATGATKARTFTATLSKASGREQKVGYAVAAGTANPGAGLGIATDGADFTATTGTLTFAAGETTKTFTVDVMGDTIDEANGERMAITLSDTGGGLAAGQSLGANQVVITDDDATPVLSVTRTDISMPETDGPAAALFEIKLSNPSSADVDWVAGPATNPGTATEAGAGPGSDDYDLLSSTTGTFAPGQTSAYALFVVNGDEVFESDETVRYTIARDNDDDATGGPLTAVLTIVNDDDAPELEITSADVTEGQTLALAGVVTGVAQSQTLLTVSLAGQAMNGTPAASTNDFSPAAFQVNIAGGTASGTVVSVGNVTITDDTTAEPAERIIVNGTGFGGTGTVKDGVLTIAASDGGTTPEPGDETITLASSAPFRLGVGNVTLSGTTTPGAMVQPWAQPLDSDAGLVEYGNEVEADEDGKFSFAGVFSNVGIKFAASINDGDLVSDPVTVFLKEDPDFYVRSSSRGKAALTVFGDPRVAGLSVRFLRANSNGTWSTVATGTLDGTGKFSRTLTGLRSGASYLYKATVYGNGDVGLLSNTSRSSRVTIR